VANSLIMIAVTLLYRYADFVTFLGGSEFDVGLIVGVGMVGSLAMRFAQGTGIDHFGARKVWLWSLVVFALSTAAHVLVDRHDGALLFLLRMVMTVSVAGIFSASITCVSRTLPVERMAEIIGTLGTSGFIAMLLGPRLGDWLCDSEHLTRQNLDLMFLVAAGLGVASLFCAALATRAYPPPQRLRRRPPLVWLVRRYHPGAILLVGTAIGVGFSLPTTFLPLYTSELGIDHISGFFTVYACTAFLARLLTRRFPQRFGVRPMILLGLASLVASLLCYIPAETAWHLVVPAIFGGVAHALLFPSVVAGGSTVFPVRYRGLGTTVMLAMIDFGTFVGAPLAGGILKYSRSLGLPAYPTMFLTIAACLVVIGLFFASRKRTMPRSTATRGIAFANLSPTAAPSSDA
jgi:MFS family permease